MLGHTTIRTTQIYAKVVERKVSDDMNVLRDKLLPKTKKYATRKGNAKNRQRKAS
jgi:site-specific recombinase XerD